MNNAKNTRTGADSNKRFMKWLKIGLIVLATGTAVYFSVTYYLKMNEKSREAIDFIPPNIFSIIHINKTDDFIHFIKENELIGDFQHLFALQQSAKNLIFYDSLFRTNPEISEIWRENDFYISSHYVGSEKFELLFIKKLSHPRMKEAVYDFFSAQTKNLNEIESKGNTRIISFTLDSIQSKMYFCVKEGVCLLSSSQQLLQNAIAISEKENPIYQDKGFSEVNETCGKSSMANFYLNNAFLFRFLSPFLDSDVIQQCDFLNNFAGWSAFDINTKENKISFTGYTSTKNIPGSFLNIFANMEQQEADLLDYVPVGVSFFLWMGYEDVVAFRNNLSDYYKEAGKGDLEESLNNLKGRTFTDNLEELIFPHIDNQFALFSLTRKLSSDKMENYAVFKVRNPEAIQENMLGIAKEIAVKNRMKIDTLTFREHKIAQLPADYFLKDIFGGMFRYINDTYFTVFDKAIVFGNSREAIMDYLNLMIAGRKIVKNQMYIDFSELVSNQGNVFFYVSPRKMLRTLPAFLIDSEAAFLEENVQELGGMEAVGVQFATSKNLYLTGLSLYRNFEAYDDVAEGWETGIEAPVAAGPWFVKGMDNAPNIILFDAFNQMYFLTDKGEVLWKIPVDGKPLGRVFTVDAFKNGKYQYLFNTESQIYLIDRLGRTVDGYPVKLPQKAVGSLNVFDYDGTRDYRLLFAGINNTIYNYTIKGTATQGWTNLKLNTAIKDSIRNLKMGGADVLLAIDKNNIAHFISRKGQKLFDVKNNPLNEYSLVYPAAKYCNCYIAATEDGSLAQISSKGSVKTKTIHETSKGVVFLYEDIDGDSNPDFLFVDKGKLYCYDDKGELKFEHDISNDTGRKSIFVKHSPFGPILFVFSSDGEQFYLMNKDGRLSTTTEYLGNYHADYSYNKQANKLYIISAKENTVYFYVVLTEQ